MGVEAVLRLPEKALYGNSLAAPPKLDDAVAVKTSPLIVTTAAVMYGDAGTRRGVADGRYPYPVAGMHLPVPVLDHELALTAEHALHAVAPALEYVFAPHGKHSA